jgi:hypothetical protein
MALTSDAISHTVLLGIVVAFMIMGAVGAVPDISSPWLLIGAAAAGVSTVVLTELLNSSGLLKQDAALGLVFPLLFALAVIFISRYVEDVHIDEDAVMVGEIGIAWANTNSHAFGDYETMVIDESDPGPRSAAAASIAVKKGSVPGIPAQFSRNSVRTAVNTLPPRHIARGFPMNRRFWFSGPVRSPSCSCCSC